MSRHTVGLLVSIFDPLFDTVSDLCCFCSKKHPFTADGAVYTTDLFFVFSLYLYVASGLSSGIRNAIKHRLKLGKARYIQFSELSAAE